VFLSFRMLLTFSRGLLVFYRKLNAFEYYDSIGHGNLSHALETAQAISPLLFDSRTSAAPCLKYLPLRTLLLSP
jgi:hypothetical protein